MDSQRAHCPNKYPARERLPALSKPAARRTVSTKLARQVLGSLHERLRGFVAADARDPDHRLQTLARQRPENLYGGLVTALMRLVFILYAEGRQHRAASTPPRPAARSDSSS